MLSEVVTANVSPVYFRGGSFSDVIQQEEIIDNFTHRDPETGYSATLTTLVIDGVPAPAPEPSTWAMLLIGFAGLGFMAYRRTSGRLARVNSAFDFKC